MGRWAPWRCERGTDAHMRRERQKWIWNANEHKGLTHASCLLVLTRLPPRLALHIDHSGNESRSLVQK